MVNLGITGFGTPLTLNRLVTESDRIIVTGSVEPHYFAGFTGGSKAFLPGIAAYESIKINHERALSPEARALALAGNPVREDIDDAMRFIKTPVFSVMTVLDKDQKIAAAFCGNITVSFEKAAEFSKKIFCVNLPAIIADTTGATGAAGKATEVPIKADIVISIAKNPMDIDLYQSQKAIDNGALALKDNGILILVASCRDGIGDKTFAGLLASAANPGEALEKIGREYKLGYHKAAKMAMVASRARIMAISELLASDLKALFIEKCSSPQTALEDAIKNAVSRGIKVPKVLVLPDGCVTVPQVE